MLATDLDGNTTYWPPGRNPCGIGFTKLVITHEDMLGPNDWLEGMLSRLCPEQKDSPHPMQKGVENGPPDSRSS